MSRRRPEYLAVGRIGRLLGPATFGKDDNALLLVDAEHARPLPADGTPADKLTLARELMAELAHRLAARR